MTDEEPHAEELPALPSWCSVSAADFDAVDLNAPVRATGGIDCIEASTCYGRASQQAMEAGRPAEERAYGLLGAICSFHFKPHDASEPFGCMMRFGARRSAEPSDVQKPLIELLATRLDCFEHLGVKARVADVIWLKDRKQAAAGHTAVGTYGSIVDAVLDKTARLRREEADEHNHEVPDFLRRALQIGRMIGWDADVVMRVRDQVSRLRSKAAEAGNGFSFHRYAVLDLDYGVSSPAAVAKEAEELAATDDLDTRHSLLHVAARAHGRDKKPEERERCLLAAAETLVAIADHHKSNAMMETHWLERAIAELNNVRNTKELRRTLKHRLIESQSRILDEMHPFSHSTDISELVRDAEKRVQGKPLSATLSALATAGASPSPARLEAEARNLLSKSVFSMLADSTVYDSQGKPVHRSPAGGIDGGDGDSVRRQISQSENIRRQLVVEGAIEPMRRVILIEHGIDSTSLSVICNYSPFVPADRVATFVAGMLRFLYGDYVAALHILLPQLENSLRHVLRQHGHDVTKLNSDMTQEDMGLSALLQNRRAELDAIFGPGLVTDIDNLCLYRGGPQLRDRVAHGLIPDWELFSSNANYACWLIFRICCLPLLPDWNAIAESIDG